MIDRMHSNVRDLRCLIREAVAQSAGSYRELGGTPLARVKKFAAILAGAQNNGELYSLNARLMKNQRPFQLNDPIKELRDGGIMYAPTQLMLNIAQRRSSAAPIPEDMVSVAREAYLERHAGLTSNDMQQAQRIAREIAAGGVVPGVKIVAHHEPAYALAAQFLSNAAH